MPVQGCTFYSSVTAKELCVAAVREELIVVERFFSNRKVVTNSGITRNYILSVMTHALDGDQFAFRIGWVFVTNS